MDTYADDLATLVKALDLRNAIHVGHFTSGGEAARYLGRHGTQRVAKAVLISAVPPLMPKTVGNPGGRQGVAFLQRTEVVCEAARRGPETDKPVGAMALCSGLL